MSVDLKVSLQNSAITACVFLVASLPQLYTKSNELLSENGSCPTYKSRLLHMLIFFGLIMMCLKYLAKSEKSWKDLLAYGLYASLLYFLFSSPDMFRLSNMVASGNIITVDDSCPTINGIMLHTVLYFVALSGWSALV